MKTGIIERPDMLDSRSPQDLRVIQLTNDPHMPCAHVYMEAQVFSPDSTLFVFERHGNAHGPLMNDPEHGYMLCDLSNGCRISPIIDELNATGIAYAPDGRHIYYLIDNPGVSDMPVALKRVRPDGGGRETLTVIGPGSLHDFTLRFIYPLSSVSSDSRRLAAGACVVDRKSGDEKWGIVVFDLETGAAEVIWREIDIGNCHAQYCRSERNDLSHDLLIQHNHGYRWDTGTHEEITRGLDPLGVDIHVIRDDGTNLRSMPWGRDGREKPQGHQCWRGVSNWAIASATVNLGDRKDNRLIEALPALEAGHKGLNSSGAVRNDLSRDFPDPQFHHFATDRSGMKMISDFWRRTADEQFEDIYLIDLGEPGRDAARQFRYLFDTRTHRHTGKIGSTKVNQSHPFLSPAGDLVFFNSAESGTLQIYMVENLPF